MAIWRQPGETMPGKFAQDDYKKFNGKAVLQGNPKAGAAYYSNFTHVNVNSGLPVFDKVKTRRRSMRFRRQPSARLARRGKS